MGWSSLNRQYHETPQHYRALLSYRNNYTMVLSRIFDSNFLKNNLGYNLRSYHKLCNPSELLQGFCKATAPPRMKYSKLYNLRPYYKQGNPSELL